MRPYRIFLWFSLSMVGLFLVACGGGSPQDTQDIEATVEAKVQAELAIEATVEARVKEQVSEKSIPATETPSPSTNINTNHEADGTFSRLIKALPQDSKYYGSSYVYLKNIKAIRDQYGLDSPLPSGNSPSLGTEEEYALLQSVADIYACPNRFKECPITPLFGAGATSWISGNNSYSSTFIKNREFLSYDLSDVEADIVIFGWEGPEDQNRFEIEVGIGSFYPDATAKTINRCTDCKTAEIKKYKGKSIYYWTEEGLTSPQDRLNPPIFDFLGRAGRFTVFPDQIMRTFWDEHMELLIDTRLGDTKSLADDKGISGIAAVMDELGANNVLLFPYGMDYWHSINEWFQSYDYEGSYSDEIDQFFNNYPMLENFQSAAYGVGKGHDGLFVVITLAYKTANDAENDRNKLLQIFESYDIDAPNNLMDNSSNPYFEQEYRGPWSEYFYNWDVWNEGEVLIARLPVTSSFSEMMSEGGESWLMPPVFFKK